jgi:chemotaxis protein methyltransferase CheR
MSERMEKFRAFLAKRTGIALDADRDYMIDTRLFPVLRQKGVADVEKLIDLAMSGRDESLTQAVVEAMLTGETFFFRDKPVFDSFRNVLLPEMIAARRDTRRLRIWCAACSTGQEPYSIAMILDEEARALRGWQIEIVATDISESAVKAARAGSYNQFEVQRGLPVALLLRYFHREAERWMISEHLRSLIDFRRSI